MYVELPTSSQQYCNVVDFLSVIHREISSTDGVFLVAVAKSDNVEAGVGETELGNHSKKNRKSGSQNGVANHNRSDGENTAQSQGSNHSKRSKNGYDALSFSRQDLYNMMLLGKIYMPLVTFRKRNNALRMYYGSSEVVGVQRNLLRIEMHRNQMCRCN